MSPGYVMQCGAMVEMSRVHDWLHGKLDIDDVILLHQDLLEVGAIPEKMEDTLAHLTEMGFLTWPGSRRFH